MENIFNDYRRELESINPKDIKKWGEWMELNPELAKKYYPKLMKELIKRTKSIEPFLMALIIQKLPGHFQKWETEADQCWGIRRTKMIQGHIDFIKAVLVDYEYPSEIERHAFESVKDELTEQLKCWEEKLQALPPQQTETKKYTAPVLGLFCGLINKIEIDKKEETESASIYCRRICVKYKLPYSDRVRQNYNVNENKKLIKELTETVLPLIDIETKSLIQKYLDNKYPPKQNLYA